MNKKLDQFVYCVIMFASKQETGIILMFNKIINNQTKKSFLRGVIIASVLAVVSNCLMSFLPDALNSVDNAVDGLNLFFSVRSMFKNGISGKCDARWALPSVSYLFISVI